MHFIFQRYRIAPDEIYQKPPGARNFIYASALTQIEKEEEAEKAREAKKARKGGN